MSQYLSPGVYVEEVPSAIKAIAGVSTSTAGFVGVVPDKIHLLAKDPAAAPGTTKFVDFSLPTPAGTPRLITSWTQFTKAFGDLIGSEAVAATMDPGPVIDTGHRNLAHAVYGFFNNGGSRCYVVRVLSATDFDDALRAFAAIDEIALVAAPGMTDEASRDKLVTHCLRTSDRFAILDGPESVSDLTTLTRIPADANPGVMPKNTDYAAWYFPWIKVFDPAARLQGSDGVIGVPPSGHLAGIYARVDNQRGVHKAPANEVILGALNVTQPLSKAEQDGLNPQGVNCIRVLNDNIIAWGARTVGGDANADLKYINVRRTLLFLRESIDEGLQWAVFEPNNPALWQKINRNVTAFLTNVWRSGALFGTTAQEAFYVKCDAETNPPELRELGQVVTEIGVSIVRPAEFVIFRISQFVAPGK
ncbi:phage tail sheath subtilisin-like domain-containing protein [Candidatus Accumulibacter cognatus]|uniref:Major tail sheath protein n=1 Tax=Candidatus Accumulibacter cognatus TaxID=2954383 RepID=A0A080M1B0_9PROT|nr:phage tail sheath subtilisin-like domain-containing protein [Candidatus Accumulibacter cognatus]KFB75033.1 MAG: major tail sheath protein [Candidatus Accumulibacter cognatus]